LTADSIHGSRSVTLFTFNPHVHALVAAGVFLPSAALALFAGPGMAFSIQKLPQ
jgi:hypothetical protein